MMRNINKCYKKYSDAALLGLCQNCFLCDKLSWSVVKEISISCQIKKKLFVQKLFCLKVVSTQKIFELAFLLIVQKQKNKIYLFSDLQFMIFKVQQCCPVHSSLSHHKYKQNAVYCVLKFKILRVLWDFEFQLKWVI